jgi:hypothetical protein
MLILTYLCSYYLGDEITEDKVFRTWEKCGLNKVTLVRKSEGNLSNAPYTLKYLLSAYVILFFTITYFKTIMNQTTWNFVLSPVTLCMTVSLKPHTPWKFCCLLNTPSLDLLINPSMFCLLHTPPLSTLKFCIAAALYLIVPYYS